MSAPTTTPNKRALFIVLEGIDGSGTTTQGDELTRWFREKGEHVHFTHEPSTGPAGMLIRLALSKRLLGSNFDFHDPDEDAIEKGVAIDGHTLALLYAADRMDHLNTEVIPNLQRGRHVVCDRYVLSTLAYQGVTVDRRWLSEINRNARKPDITIFLDVSVEHSRQRMRKTRWTRDLYEGEDDLRRIRNEYLQSIREWSSYLGPLVILDGSKPIPDVRREIRGVLEQFISTGRVPGIARPEAIFASHD